MRLFLLSVVISFSSQLLGQYLWCDTYLDKNNTNNRNGVIDQQGASFKLNKIEHINIALSLFNIHESDEWGKVSSETINEAVEHLNRVFQPSNISFFILDEIKYIESDYLSYFNYGENSISQNMIDNLYSVKGTMNVYLLPSAHENNTVHVGWAAKAYFPEEEKDKILILAESFSGSVLAHEMGHALSLYHTHETQFGKELVNGSNCSTAGDLLCDTPADPGIYDDSVDPECKYINVSKDSNGDKYAPLANNIMSYAPNKCRSVFTPQQIERMRLAYYHYKTHLHKKEYMALFSTDDATICVGQTAHFSNKSLNAESYHWSFEGGHPSSSTNINPIVLYERPGDYDVTLTITTKEGDTHSFVEENCIVVKNKAQFEDVMVSGSFENNILLEEVINPDYGSAFELTNSASSEGNQCVMFNLYSDYLDGAQDFLIIGQLNNSTKLSESGS